MAICLPSNYFIVSFYSGFNATADEFFSPSSVRVAGLGTKITPVDHLHQLPTSRIYANLNATLPTFMRVTRTGWIFNTLRAVSRCHPEVLHPPRSAYPPNAPLLLLGARDPCCLDLDGLNLGWSWVPVKWKAVEFIDLNLADLCSQFAGPYFAGIKKD